VEVLEQHLHLHQVVEYLLLHRKGGEAEAAWNWQECIHLSSIDEEEGSNLVEAVAVASKAEAEKSNNSKEVVDSVHGNYVFFYLCFCYYCYYYSMNHPSHTHSLN